MHADAMNTQVHEATGASPYELVFGQKPRSVLFPTTTASGVILEEDLIDEGVQFGIVEQLTKGSEDDITVKGTAEDAEGMLVEMPKPRGKKRRVRIVSMEKLRMAHLRMNRRWKRRKQGGAQLGPTRRVRILSMEQLRMAWLRMNREWRQRSQGEHSWG